MCRRRSAAGRDARAADEALCAEALAHTALSRRAMGSPALVDSFGRVARDLRLSVTDRCNLRCRYCMPAEGVPYAPRTELLTIGETVRLVALLARLGIRRLRITGGEPLLRGDLVDLAAALRRIPEIERLAITTNGVLLERRAAELAAAGISHFNVSLDSLSAQRFAAITRRPLLRRVLAGLAALERTPGVERIKVNVVATRDFSDRELFAFVELARTRPYEVRFLEFMPLDGERSWRPDAVVTASELRERIERRYALEELPRPAGATARAYRFADGSGTIAFVSPVSAPFCGDCTRLRLTADGHLKTCLFASEELDLRTPLRAGASDRELAALVRGAVARKPRGHTIATARFTPPERTMSAIGG